jgi:tetratricopeptide (TPR) repeat protein
VAANKIRAGLAPTADLDGDGRADIAFLGRRGGDNSASYSVIYRSTPQGYVLADYHELSVGVGPALPRVALPIPKAAPIIEDGRDEPLVNGNSLSVRRLRRWNGTRFVTMLTYCKNHLLFEQGKPAHTAGQRVVGVDVDKNGTTEVVIRGFDRPRVFRVAPDGQALTEDAGLTESYRQTLPNHQQALALQKQAADLAKNSAQLPQAVKLLNRARLMAPYEVNIALDLADGVLRMNRGAQVIALLERTRGLDPKRAEPDCLLGRAYEQMGDRAKEQAALESCLKLNPPPAFQQSAAQRMKELGK